VLEILDGNRVGSSLGELPHQDRVATEVDIVILGDNLARRVEETDDAIEACADGTRDDLEDHFLASTRGEAIRINVAGLGERPDEGGGQPYHLRFCPVIGLVFLDLGQSTDREAQLIGDAERRVQAEAMHAVWHVLRDRDHRGKLELPRLVLNGRVGADDAFWDDHLFDGDLFDGCNFRREARFAEYQASRFTDVRAGDRERGLRASLGAGRGEFLKGGWRGLCRERHRRWAQ
jgi:hypothetical protein